MQTGRHCVFGSILGLQSALLLLLAVIGSTCLADVVTTADGRRIEGVIVKQTEDQVLIEVKRSLGSVQMWIARKNIVSIEATESPEREFGNRRAALRSGDSAGRLVLAIWCIEKNMTREAATVLLEIVETDSAGEKELDEAVMKLQGLGYPETKTKAVSVLLEIVKRNDPTEKRLSISVGLLQRLGYREFPGKGWMLEKDFWETNGFVLQPGFGSFTPQYPGPFQSWGREYVDAIKSRVRPDFGWITDEASSLISKIGSLNKLIEDFQKPGRMSPEMVATTVESFRAELVIVSQKQEIAWQKMKTRLDTILHPPTANDSEKAQPKSKPDEGHPTKSGSGFLITADGFIVTNHHVVEGSEHVEVMTESGMRTAKVIGLDKENDLCLLKVDGNYSPIPFAEERSAALGQTVFALGFPMPDVQGVEPKVTKGVISSLSGIRDDSHCYQIDAAVQPGNSGGPLADEYGRLVGVIVAKLNDASVFHESGSVPQNVNYAIKKSYLQAFLDGYPEVSKNTVTGGPKGLAFEEAVARVRKSTVLVICK